MTKYLSVLIFLGFSFSQNSDKKVELITEEGYIIILHPDRTWSLKEIKNTTEGELDDGTGIVVNPDKTWSYKLVELDDETGSDVLTLQNGQEYRGNYISKNNNGITFHVEKMPKPQTLPNSLIAKLILRNGDVVFESKSNEAFQKALKNESTKKQVASPVVEKSLLEYKNTIDAEYVKKVKGGTSFDSYKTKNGTLISIGDTLIIGSPGTSDKQNFGLGTSKKSVFSFILMGSFGFNTIVQMFGRDAETINLPATSQGESIVVEKIYVMPFKTKSFLQLPIIVLCRNTLYDGFGQKRTITDIEKALLMGEIISKNAPMTREQAIKNLKEAKELLELDIIPQSEYDALKDELTPIIRRQ